MTVISALTVLTLQQKEETANRTDLEISTCVFENITIQINAFSLIHFDFNSLYIIRYHMRIQIS